MAGLDLILTRTISWLLFRGPSRHDCLWGSAERPRAMTLRTCGPGTGLKLTCLTVFWPAARTLKCWLPLVFVIIGQKLLGRQPHLTSFSMQDFLPGGSYLVLFWL